MTKYVLDSWALMAWMKGEDPGRRRVRALLEGASQGRLELRMNLINVGEVYYLLVKRGQRERAEEFLNDLGPVVPIRTLLPDRDLILAAARLKGEHPISYADAFAAVTAVREGAPLVTGDPELGRLPGLELEWVGAGAQPSFSASAHR